MAGKTKATPTNQQPDTYFALVKKFPLPHIRDDDHLKAAIEVINL